MTKKHNYNFLIFLVSGIITALIVYTIKSNSSDNKNQPNINRAVAQTNKCGGIDMDDDDKLSKCLDYLNTFNPQTLPSTFPEGSDCISSSNCGDRTPGCYGFKWNNNIRAYLAYDPSFGRAPTDVCLPYK